jgi:hypothetical protein
MKNLQGFVALDPCEDVKHFCNEDGGKAVCMTSLSAVSAPIEH